MLPQIAYKQLKTAALSRSDYHVEELAECDFPQHHFGGMHDPDYRAPNARAKCRFNVTGNGKHGEFLVQIDIVSKERASPFVGIYVRLSGANRKSKNTASATCKMNRDEGGHYFVEFKGKGDRPEKIRNSLVRSFPLRLIENKILIGTVPDDSLIDSALEAAYYISAAEDED